MHQKSAASLGSLPIFVSCQRLWSIGFVYEFNIRFLLQLI